MICCRLKSEILKVCAGKTRSFKTNAVARMTNAVAKKWTGCPPIVAACDVMGCLFFQTCGNGHFSDASCLQPPERASKIQPSTLQAGPPQLTAIQLTPIG